MKTHGINSIPLGLMMLTAITLPLATIPLFLLVPDLMLLPVLFLLGFFLGTMLDYLGSQTMATAKSMTKFSIVLIGLFVGACIMAILQAERLLANMHILLVHRYWLVYLITGAAFFYPLGESILQSRQEEKKASLRSNAAGQKDNRSIEKISKAAKKHE